jgi:uncharacterized delta-60 repeat protein
MTPFSPPARRSPNRAALRLDRLEAREQPNNLLAVTDLWPDLLDHPVPRADDAPAAVATDAQLVREAGRPKAGFWGDLPPADAGSGRPTPAPQPAAAPAAPIEPEFGPDGGEAGWVNRGPIPVPGSGQLVPRGGGAAPAAFGPTSFEGGTASSFAPGSLDPTFGGGDGMVTASGNVLNAVALQGDRLVVLGAAPDRPNGGGTARPTVARFLPDGSPDMTFGTNGRYLLEGGATTDALAVQPDGKIVVATDVSTKIGKTTTYDFRVYRLDANGQGLDPTFGTNGSVTLDFGTGAAGVTANDRARAVVLQPDGRIVVAGSADLVTKTSTTNRTAVVRLNPNGTLDPGFGTGGRAVFVGLSSPLMNTAALQGDRILIGGDTGPVFRLTAAGALDPTFGTNGVADRLMDGGMKGLAVQPDGRIVTAMAHTGVFRVGRYTADGQPDTTFGPGGLAVAAFTDGGPHGGCVIQPDGKIVASGSYGVASSAGSTRTSVVRYNPDGTLDGTFGVGGVALADFPRPYEMAHGMTLQPDGHIVTVGGAYDPGLWALARFTP